ncbi:MAG: glycosyltransferase family 4 protein [Deltaproteobacteria bacterium]|nr:glycosyltransferase family 4 protein [Deltaproteobacteria bacterium]
MNEADVVVAHPGTQHSYEAAVAFQQAGLLQEYITGIYFRMTGTLRRLLTLAPDKVSRAVLSQLARRHRPGLREALVRTRPLPEAAYLASTRLPLPAWVSSQLLQLRNLLFDRFVASRIEELSPAVVVCYDTCALQGFRAASRVGALRVLDQTNCHLAWSSELADPEGSSNFHSSLHQRMPPRWLIGQCIEEAKLANVILAGSGFVKESLAYSGVNVDKVVILPYGADIELFSPAPKKSPDGPVTVAFAGQIGLRKGTPYLLDAFHRLERLNCRLLLIGQVQRNGQWLEKYHGHYEHVPFVPRVELAHYLRRADVFVYPSLREGSALAIYEALASGLPVITTPNSGSVVRDKIEGFVIAPRDVGALADKIEQLVVNEDLRRTMGEAARKRAEEYSWSNYHRRLVAVIREALVEQNSGGYRGKTIINGFAGLHRPESRGPS